MAELGIFLGAARWMDRSWPVGLQYTHNTDSQSLLDVHHRALGLVSASASMLTTGKFGHKFEMQGEFVLYWNSTASLAADSVAVPWLQHEVLWTVETIDLRRWHTAVLSASVSRRDVETWCSNTDDFNTG